MTPTSDSTAFYITPSYIYAKPVRPPRERSILQALATRKMQKAERDPSKVSDNSAKKIRKAVQWLVYMAREKVVTSAVTGKKHKYRAGLLTVSLPTGCADVDAVFFREVLLTSIIEAMKYKFQLRNYIWKIEKQNRGALHAHITVDQYIPYQWLQATWCKLLDKHGLLEEYRNQHASLSLKGYVESRMKNDSQDKKARFSSHLQYVKSLVKGYRKGEREGWSLPNCTDVHSVRNVKKLAGYMVTYLSKDPNLEDDFKGRFWSSSYSLSRLRSVKCEVPMQVTGLAYQEFKSIADREEEVYTIARDNSRAWWIGSMLYLSRDRRTLDSSKLFRSIISSLDALYHGVQEFIPPEFTWDVHHGLELNQNCT